MPEPLSERENLARLLFSTSPHRMPDTYPWSRQPEKPTRALYRAQADALMDAGVGIHPTDKEN